MKSRIKILYIALAAVLCITFAGCDDKKADDSAKVEKLGIIKAVITVEGYGDIKLELDGDTAPRTVANFVKLVNDKFYDGLTFHRSVPDFMIQGGDPEGNGNGGSDEAIKGEFSQNGIENTISHVRGTISMARRSNDMDSASSQFFIVQKDSAFLDGGYAAFGKVTEGMEIIDKMIADAPVVDSYTGLIDPSKQPRITSVKIIE